MTQDQLDADHLLDRIQGAPATVGDAFDALADDHGRALQAGNDGYVQHYAAFRLCQSLGWPLPSPGVTAMLFTRLRE